MTKNGAVKGAVLAGVEIFAGMELAVREDIARQCTGRNFKAGATILNQLDEGRNVFFVLSGVVEVSLYSANGRRIAFLDKGAGQMVGELAAIDGAPRCATVTAKTDCYLASLSPEAFMAAVANNPAATERLLKRLTGQVRELSGRVFEFNALCVKNRIHVELLRAARNGAPHGNGRLISPAPTHADIAARASTHREAVTRELSQLTKNGLLEKAANGLVVTDLLSLQALVEETIGEIPLVC